MKAVEQKTHYFPQAFSWQATRQEVEFISSIFRFTELLEKTLRREEEVGALQVYFLFHELATLFFTLQITELYYNIAIF